jgi:Fe-S-cluster containining protein
MSTKDLFTEHLAVDWWEDYGDGDDRRAYVIAPAIVGHEGWYYPTHPKGRCSFYLNERCLIHPVKPIECARAWCGEPFTQDKADKTSRHKKGIARAWQKSKPKSMIEELLGHKPNAAAYTRTNSFEALFSHLFESIDIG